MLWDVFRAHVVGRVRGPCCGMCSGHMLWDVFGAHVMGHVQGPCSGTCSGPMLCCMATTSKWGSMLWGGGGVQAVQIKSLKKKVVGAMEVWWSVPEPFQVVGGTVVREIVMVVQR